MTKYIFISGGVISGVGKGISAATIGFLLKSHGLKVSMIKADPYVNVDAGTMNPLEHGETFVLEDGLETDMDMGHYERFTAQLYSRFNYMTTGAVYLSVIQRERQMGYGGKCVQVYTDIPGEIVNRIKDAAKHDKADVVVVEIGGTVGEYEAELFLEANRIMKLKHPKDVLHIHVGYFPIPSMLGEMKTKPTQISVRSLNRYGIIPDFIIARSIKPIDDVRKEKVSYFCNLPKDHIISAPDAKSVYEVPINFEKEDFSKILLRSMGLDKRRTGLFTKWVKQYDKVRNLNKKVKIGMVAKYYKSGDFDLKDSYVSVNEAINHAAWHLGVDPDVEWFVSDGLENDKAMQKELLKMDGILVPQGWGSRGVEGKLKAVQIARENKVPYLGLCFGMQMAAIEYARNVLGLKGANSEEADPETEHKIIHLMEEQKKHIKKKHFGGTIRLGAWPCEVKEGSLLESLYKEYKNEMFTTLPIVQERHRHRYEFNNQYREQFEKAGLIISGTSPDGMLVEAVELPKKTHPFFLGTQYHPELKSQFLNPHPIFLGFIKACLGK